MKAFDEEQQVEIVKRSESLISQAEVRIVLIIWIYAGFDLIFSEPYNLVPAIVAGALMLWYTVTQSKRIRKVMFEEKKAKNVSST